MEIYVYANKPYSKEENEFLSMVEPLKNIADGNKLLENSFRLIDNVRYVRFWNISLSEKKLAKNGKVRDYQHPVVFGVIIDAKSLEITEIEVIDDMFGQPHFVNADYNKKIKGAVDSLLEAGVFIYAEEVQGE